MARPLVKICCIADAEEARLAVACGAAALGLVSAMPSGPALVQVIHVIDDRSVAEALAACPFVDALLLDSGNQNLAVKELGGTGRTHDWRLSRRIREAATRPVWLAGGLSPENVAEAIAAVDPHGLDLCSRVRTDGRLDRGKLERFFAALPD